MWKLKEKAWSHDGNAALREPCPDTNIKAGMGFYTSLMVKCQTPKASQLSHPPWHVSQSTHFQSLAQVLGKWARARCCSKPPAERSSCRCGKSRHWPHWGGSRLTPWSPWLALRRTNSSWLCASTVCVSLKRRTLRTKCFWSEWSQRILDVPLLYQAIFCISLILSARMWLEQERHWGFSVS